MHSQKSCLNVFMCEHINMRYECKINARYTTKAIGETKTYTQYLHLIMIHKINNDSTPKYSKENFAADASTVINVSV